MQNCHATRSEATLLLIILEWNFISSNLENYNLLHNPDYKVNLLIIYIKCTVPLFLMLDPVKNINRCLRYYRLLEVAAILHQ